MRMKLADRCGLTLAELAVADPRIFVLDGDLADSDGAICFAERHPSRFLMGGIAEQNLVSAAAGMADAGMSPWVFSFAAFLCYRAYDQIRVCMSQAQKPVTLIGSHAGGLSGRNGKTHAALNDLALMASLPHLGVWAPADFGDVEYAVRSIHAMPRPTYVRLPRVLFREADALPGVAAPWRWLRERRPIVLVSTGLASWWALDAARRLTTQGVEVGVLHCLQLRPWPALAGQLAGAELVFVIEDHCSHGGLATLLRHATAVQPAACFAWPDDYSGCSGADDELLDNYNLSGAALARAVMKQLDQELRGGGARAVGDRPVA